MLEEESDLERELRFRESDKGFTYEEIGEQLGMTAENVRQTERRALIKLLYNHGPFLKELLEGYKGI